MKTLIEPVALINTLLIKQRRRQWHPTPILLPGKSHGWEEPGRLQFMGSQSVGTTERLHFYFSLSCIGEGNGNPLQCSCLENPRDGGVWWAAVYGVAQSWRRLKRLSCSSSSSVCKGWPVTMNYLFFSTKLLPLFSC